MPRILQRYVFFEMSKVFVLALLALTVLMALGIVFRTLESVGAEVGLVAIALPYILPLVWSYTFPIAVLFSTTLVYGRMSADNEITAAQTGGVHLMTLVSPAILIGLILSLATIFINSYLIPVCHFRLRSVLKGKLDVVIEKELSENQIKLKDTIITFKDYDPSTRTLKDVFIRQGDDGRVTKEIHAKKARIIVENTAKKITLVLEDVSATLFSKGREKIIPVRSRKQSVVYDLKSLEVKKDYDDMPTYELLQEISVKGKSELPGIRTEIQKRYSMSLSCVAFVLIGVPLGIFLKKGHTLSAFAVSCLPVFLLYYPLLMLGQSLGNEGALDPVIAMWLPNILMAAIGLALFGWLFKR